ncbi:MAG: M48 family metalloprotease, partial [Acidobacteriota bacterium]
NFGSWFFSDTIVLKSAGVVPVPEGQLDWLREDLVELSARANMPVPQLYLQPHEASPNAFATGRSPAKGVVAVTAGLLNTLDRREVRGVLAHELGHIKNRDTLVSAVAATIAGAITFLASFARFGAFGRGRQGGSNPLVLLIMSMLAPLAAMVIRMAISRTREYGADRRAAELTGDPEGLALALEGLSRGVTRRPMERQQAQSVHFIVHGFTGGLSKLMSTHPPIPERARRLREMAAGMR